MKTTASWVHIYQCVFCSRARNIVPMRFERYFFKKDSKKMNFVPKREYVCREEYIEFNKILERVRARRGKRKEKHIKDLQIFFCEKIYEVMMRQRGYFTEILTEKVELERKVKGLQNEINSLRYENPKPMSLKDLETRIKSLEN